MTNYFANSGWCGLENVSAGCANDLGQPHSLVLDEARSGQDYDTTIRFNIDR
jgi:hypothetical protein